MRRIKNFIKNNKLLIIFFAIFSVGLLAYFFKMNTGFYVSLDQRDQYDLFYYRWYEMLDQFLKGDEFPFYSFYSFLGNDFFSSKSYYLVGDPYTYIGYVLSKVITEYTLVFTILKYGVSLFLFNYYLNYIGVKNNQIRNLGAILYAFSGTAMLWLGDYMFLSFYSLFPLFLIGIERWLKEHKIFIFIVSVTILCCTNFYFFFFTSIFLPLIYLFRTSLQENRKPLKQELIHFILLCLGYVVGVMIASVIFVPTVLNILSNPRLGSADFPMVWDIKVYFAFLFNLLVSPFNIYSEAPYMFYIDGFNGHGHWFSFYTTCLMALILPAVFKSSNKNKKIYIWSLFIFVVILIFPVFSSIIHAFSQPTLRWTFILSTFMILMLVEFYDEIEFKPSVVSAAVLSALFTMIIGYIHFSGVLNLKPYRIHLIVIMIEIIIMWVCCALVKLDKKKLIHVVLVECCMGISLYVYWHQVRFNENNEYNLNLEYVNYFKEENQDIYLRQYIPNEITSPYSDVNYNLSLYYGYATSMTYDTTMEPSMMKFTTYINDYQSNFIDIDNLEIMKMLGIKYYGVLDESDLPDNADGWEYSHNLNHIQMYKMGGTNQLGHTYSKCEVNIEDKESYQWNEVLFVEDEGLLNYCESIKPAAKEQMQITGMSSNRLTGFISNSEDTILFIALPYNRGWKIFDNGVEMDMYDVQKGFMGIPLKAGEHNIEMQFRPFGIEIGLILSLMGILGLIVIFIRETKFTKQ